MHRFGCISELPPCCVSPLPPRGDTSAETREGHSGPNEVTVEGGARGSCCVLVRGWCALSVVWAVRGHPARGSCPSPTLKWPNVVTLQKSLTEAARSLSPPRPLAPGCRRFLDTRPAGQPVLHGVHPAEGHSDLHVWIRTPRVDTHLGKHAGRLLTG